MKAIRLIQKDPELLPRPVTPGSQIYESGFWYLPIEQAESLIGCDIFFHEKQKSPSFFGGVIKSCKIQQGSKWEGRVIFEFEALTSHKGKRPKTSEGWNWEMKLED
jgi:hypothetical protein